MVDILVTGDTVFTGDEILPDGYVYIEDGKVKAVGSGLPPEDLTYASLILGGRGRIIVPAIAWPVDPVGYVLKTPSCNPPSVPCTLRRSLGSNEARLALAAVLEANMHGVGIPLLVVSSPSVAVAVAEMLGSPMGALVPGECGPAEPHPRLAAVARPPREPSVCPARDLCRSGNAYEASRELARALGMREPRIHEGGTAMIAIFDSTRPPLLGAAVRSVEDAGSVYGTGATAESLIVGEEILVEVGEHLYIVEKHVRDALRIAEKLRGSEIEGDITG